MLQVLIMVSVCILVVETILTMSEKKPEQSLLIPGVLSHNKYFCRANGQALLMKRSM